MIDHTVVSHDEWLQARRAFLTQEKAFTRERDCISAARRALPWERVEQEYVFSGPRGEVTLADLFGGCRQLIVYHFMFPPEWDAGCPHCSFWADSFDGTAVHLRARDITTVPISAQQRSSANGVPAATGSADFSAGTDSPVSTDSSHSSPAVASSRRSAGTTWPSCTSTTSPGTSPVTSTVRGCPPRSTTQR